MAIPPDELSLVFLDAARMNIPEECLADKGYETEPHVTCAWGFQGVSSPQIQDAISRLSDGIRMQIGRVVRSSGVEDGTCDAIVIQIDSPDLVALRDVLMETFKDKVARQTHEFSPHLTLAYIKKGACPELDGKQFVIGSPELREKYQNGFTATTLGFSSEDGTQTDIPLTEEQNMLIVGM